MREPMEEKGKQGLSSPPPRPTAPSVECPLPVCSGNFPTFMVIDGSREKEDGTVVKLNSGTINCDYEPTKRPRPLNRTLFKISPTTLTLRPDNATVGMATGGGPEEASQGEVSEEGEEPVQFRERE